MKITKITDEMEINVHVVLPTIKFNHSIKKVDGSLQKVNIFSLPINFMLTNDEKYLKLEVCLIIGLCLTIKLKEVI